MHHFIYTSQPGRVVFGPGALQHLAREIEALGAGKALILCAPEQRASAQRVGDLLGGRAAGIFDRAVMHVPIETAREARAVAQGLGADCAVAIGEGELPLADLLQAVPPGIPLSVEAPTLRLAGRPFNEQARIVGETTRRFLSTLSH